MALSTKWTWFHTSFDVKKNSSDTALIVDAHIWTTHENVCDAMIPTALYFLVNLVWQTTSFEHHNKTIQQWKLGLDFPIKARRNHPNPPNAPQYAKQTVHNEGHEGFGHLRARTLPFDKDFVATWSHEMCCVVMLHVVWCLSLFFHTSTGPSLADYGGTAFSACPTPPRLQLPSFPFCATQGLLTNIPEHQATWRSARCFPSQRLGPQLKDIAHFPRTAAFGCPSPPHLAHAASWLE